MKNTLILMAAVLTAAITVSAQDLFLGPQFGYTVAVNTPDQVRSEGAPSRLVLGLRSIIPVSKKAEVRVSASYRMESGSFATPWFDPSPGSMQRPDGKLNVVDPTNPAPDVISTVESSSVEVMAGMHFPVASLDTSGSKITIGLSVLTDYMLSGSQSDDYSGVPDYTGDTPQNFEYVANIGFGAAIGAGLILPMGEAGRLGFDLQYVFREPREIDVANTNPTEEVNVSWLVGRGLRLTLSYAFAL